MRIEIPYWSTHHNHFLYSFSIYAAKNRIKLKISLNDEIPANGAILYVDQKVLFFDYSDDTNLIETPSKYDAYFKRSLVKEDGKQFLNVYPLNFHVNFSSSPYHLLNQMDPAIFFKKESFVELIRAIDTFGWFTNEYHGSIDIKKFQSKEDSKGKVIFMTRLWDPARHHDPEEKERRRKQNDFRANACRIIKKYFPDSIVGLYPDNFAVKTAGDILLDIRNTKKKFYLETLSNCDIGIADDGLKDTPGWKIGEYVLFGKAIVSTPITTVIEQFHEGINYLSTGSRENYQVLPDLINQLKKDNFYQEIQNNNKIWYSRFLEPNAYVSHILSRV